MTMAAVLSLDYDRIASVWEGGSVFSPAQDDLSSDKLGDFMLNLENEDMLSFQRDCEARLHKEKPFASRLAFKEENLSILDYAAVPHPSSHWDAWGNSWPSANKKQNPAFAALPTSARQHLVRNDSMERGATVPDSLQHPYPAIFGGPDYIAANPFGVVPQLSPHLAPQVVPQVIPAYSEMPPAIPILSSQQQLSIVQGDVLSLRQECLRRYREKKARRMYTKMVRYHLRKVNADRRPRIKGRFVKKEEQERLEGGACAPTDADLGAVISDSHEEERAVCLSDEEGCSS